MLRAQTLTLVKARATLHEVFLETTTTMSTLWDDDVAALEWMNSPDGQAAVEGHVRAVRAAHIASSVEVRFIHNICTWF